MNLRIFYKFFDAQEPAKVLRNPPERNVSGSAKDILDSQAMATDIHFCDASLVRVWQKVLRGERLTIEDGMTMYRTRDLLSLGKMAHYVQQQKSGDAVYFVLTKRSSTPTSAFCPASSVTLPRRREDPTRMR